MTAKHWRELLMLSTLPFSLALLVALDTRTEPSGWAWVNGVALLAAVPVSLVVHELGHAAAARLLGMQVAWVTLGDGPVLARQIVGETVVEINAVPAAGRTLATLRGRSFRRLRLWLMAAAGPAANLAVVPAVMLLLDLSFQEVWPRGYLTENAMLETVACLNLVQGLGNLVPFRLANGRMTDGARLLSLPFTSARKLDEHAAFAYVAEAARHYLLGDHAAVDRIVDLGLRDWPDDPWLRMEHAIGRYRRGQHLAALEELQQTEPATREREPALQSLLDNCIASIAALTDDPERLADADLRSARALERLPIQEVLVTRATVLAALGRADEALAMLARARGLARSRAMLPATRAAVAATVAVAQLARGELAAAQAALAEARAAHLEAPEVAWAEARLRAAVDPPAAANLL